MVKFVHEAPETILKKRDEMTEEQMADTIRKEKRRQESARQRKRKAPKTPGLFIAEYRNRQKSYASYKTRTSKAQTPDDKLLLVIQIHKSGQVSAQVKVALKKLRLGKLYLATFVKNDAETCAALAAAEPYITYGPPSKEMVESLIRHRGTTYIAKKRKTIKDNSIVEQILGKHGILCVDDLVYELTNVTEKFKKANNFINPFLLTAPEHTFAKKNSFMRGGDYGDRGAAINILAEQMK